MNTTHKATLLAAFTISFFVQPSWVYNNFWVKADFYDSIPFVVPYFVYAAIAALLATATCEIAIRFVKKYL
jgi:hypothetical protein